MGRTAGAFSGIKWFGKHSRRSPMWRLRSGVRHQGRVWATEPVCFSSLLHVLIVSQIARYSEQKNCPTKGQISLVGQITAQITKVNPWEISITKIGILSFVVPSSKHLAPVVKFILTLRWDPFDGTVFFAHHKVGSTHTYHMTKPQI